MNQQAVFNQHNFTLSRYPKSNHDRSLQAWDSADELILEQLSQRTLDNLEVVIYNDAFGALTSYCLAMGAKVTTFSDSWLSHRGIQANLKANELDESRLTLCHCEQSIELKADIVLVKIPRTLALLKHQLAASRSYLSDSTQIIGGAKVKDVHNSTLKLFEQFIGETKTSLAKKKSRLIFATWQNPDTNLDPVITQWPLEGSNFTITNNANVFSRERLDIGGRFLMNNLPENLAAKNIIDLGCGNGVVGLSVLAEEETSKLCFVDESFMAISSAKQNITDNLPHLVDNCEFKVNNCLGGFDANSADIVLCNPPFHQQNTLTEHIAKQMFSDAKRVLKRGGELRIVANSHLPYPDIIKRLFGGYRKVASNKKFVILSALK